MDSRDSRDAIWIASGVAGRHAIEGIEVEQRRVSGAPSVTVRCSCGSALDMGDGFSLHVAEITADAVFEEMPERGEA